MAAATLARWAPAAERCVLRPAALPVVPGRTHPCPQRFRIRHQQFRLDGRRNAAPETQFVADPLPGASEQPADVDAPADQAEADGPLSGDWTLWWTNALGDTSPGFTIRFSGDTSGTIEVLNDNTDTETFFELNDDTVRLGFTRVLEHTGPEKDFFIGTFAEDGIVYGEWTREGGEDGPLVFEAFLVRDT